MRPIVAALTLLLSAAPAFAADRVLITNACNKPVEVFTRLIDPTTKTMRITRWFTIKPDETQSLSSTATDTLGRSLDYFHDHTQALFYYAQTTDKTFVWQGSNDLHTFTLNNITYNMAKSPGITNAEDNHALKLTCNAQPARPPSLPPAESSQSPFPGPALRPPPAQPALPPPPKPKKQDPSLR